MSDQTPEQLPCHICGKEKGQPPERCNGHYDEPGNIEDEVEVKKPRPSTSRITIDNPNIATIPCPNCQSPLDIHLGKPGAHNYATVSVLIIEHCGEITCGTCNFKVMPQIAGIKGFEITVGILMQEGNVILSPSMEKAMRDIRGAYEQQRGLHEIARAAKAGHGLPTPNAKIRR